MSYEKRELIGEGKTKKIWNVDDPRMVCVEYKNTITAYDDQDLTKEFLLKAEYSNATTCRIFEFLGISEVPVAYIKQLSPTEFLAWKCDMIPLEVVGRRYAVGSYIKRHPIFKRYLEVKGEEYRFSNLVVEYFLKTSKGKLIKNKKVLVEVDAQKGEEDPYIQDVFADFWKLYHSKKPSGYPGAFLGKKVWRKKVIENKETIRSMENYFRNIFSFLEKAWDCLTYCLIDLKVEFGFDFNRKLRVADVIDNDSWRLRDPRGKELSKEVFRQGGELKDIERNYCIVAAMTERWRDLVKI